MGKGDVAGFLFHAGTCVAAVQVATVWAPLAPETQNTVFTTLALALGAAEMASVISMVRARVPAKWFFSLKGMRKAGAKGGDATALFCYLRIVAFDFLVVWWMAQDLLHKEADTLGSPHSLLRWLPYLLRAVISGGHLHSVSSLALYLALSRGLSG